MQFTTIKIKAHSYPSSKTNSVAREEAQRYNQYGGMEMMFGQYEKALAQFHTALCYDLSYITVWENVITAQKANNVDESLIEQYEKVLERLKKADENYIVCTDDSLELPQPVLDALADFDFD